MKRGKTSLPRLQAYVADWDIPKTIAWDKLDHILYAFAVPDQSGKLGKFNEKKLQTVVQQAHTNGKDISLSIGGWTGSVFFSSLISTPDNRDKFSTILVNAVRQYDLDGLNLDWEYPNANNGVSCNQKDPNDTENLLQFVILLRKKLNQAFPKENKWITMAVAAKVFNGPDQRPLKQLSPHWAQVVDAFYIMAYDLRGQWDKFTGANSPMVGQGITVTNAMEAWHAAGIPRQQLVLGVPFYGYTVRTHAKAKYSTSMNYPLHPSRLQIQGDQYDSAEMEPCANAKPTYSGEYQWRSIVQDGILNNKAGWHSIWDRTSKTPYSINLRQKKFLTFDDPASLRIKADFVNKNDLGGIMLWSLEMDDDKNSLLNAIQSVRY
ncbi:glycoside hydrolase superfamily [Cunninghamella echinulata]|nr:glycoside hydrolase superfamily [Cunninghamella echinulata]